MNVSELKGMKFIECLTCNWAGVEQPAYRGKCPQCCAEYVYVRPKGRAKGKKDRGMNRNEASYDRYLRDRFAAGEIAVAFYEAVKFRFADSTYYTPDFMVIFPDGLTEFHECKGFKRKPSGEPGYWSEEDAKLKIKIAAEMYPFTFKIVFQEKNGIWHAEVI